MFGSRQSSSSESSCSISCAAEHSYYMEKVCVAIVSVGLSREVASINVGLSSEVQIVLIQGATEHAEEVSTLICNTHRPSSSKRPFTSKERIEFCEHVLRHTINAHSARPNNVGFVLGGDANVDESDSKSGATESSFSTDL